MSEEFWIDFGKKSHKYDQTTKLLHLQHEIWWEDKTVEQAIKKLKEFSRGAVKTRFEQYSDAEEGSGLTLHVYRNPMVTEMKAINKGIAKHNEDQEKYRQARKNMRFNEYLNLKAEFEGK